MFCAAAGFGCGGADISDNLNAALKYAHEMDEEDGADVVYTVKVPAGTYKLTQPLHIYSNTTLSMKGATIQGQKSLYGNMLMDARDCTIEKNTITGTGWAIYLNKKCRASVGRNTMKKNKNNRCRRT